MADLKEFAEQLVNLTVKEVNELADILKNEYGIEPAAAAPVAVAAGGGGDAGGAEEKSAFDVVLKSAGANKLKVVKAVKELALIHEVQLVNYLKATGIETGLLINFGRSVDIKRKVLDFKQ